MNIEKKLNLSKKGTVQKVVEIGLVTIVVLLILGWFFGATGIGTRMVKKTSDFFIENMPLSQGKKYSKESDVGKDFGGLVNSFALAATSPDKRCFVRLGEFPRDYAGYKLSFEQSTDGILAQMTYMDSDTPVHKEIVKGMQLCYVAGNGVVSTHFYNNWLADSIQQTKAREYNVPSDKIEFIKKKGIFLKIGKKDGMFIDNKDYGYNIGFLYKADKDKICFIPSYKNQDCAANLMGISEGCISNLEEVYSKNKCTRPTK